MTREELEAENKDLKALRKYETTVASAEIEKLQAENAELKEVRDNCEQQFQNKVDELGIEVSKNIKAKEIIQKLTEFAKSEIEYNPEHPEEHTKSWNELCKRAEDFIKG